jgi:AcrR family transcriptional regulator
VRALTRFIEVPSFDAYSQKRLRQCLTSSEGLSARPGLNVSETVRHTITTAALELFGTHGFEQVTVQQIVDHAGVSRATFYRYYSSKEAAFFDGRDEDLAALQAAFADITTTDLMQVRHALSGFAQHMQAKEDAVRARVAIVQDSPHLRRAALAERLTWEDALTATFADQGASPLAARTRAAAILGCLHAAVSGWPAGGAGLEDLAQEALTALRELLAD